MIVNGVKILELDSDKIIKRISYYGKNLRMFVVEGFGYVGAVEIITEGPGAFGQGGRAVVVIRNFVKFTDEGLTAYYVPHDYFIARIPTRINDERLPQKIVKRLKAKQKREESK